MTVSDAMQGGVAGAVATAPMTAFMTAVFPSLPLRDRYPLPPREITMNVAKTVGLDHQLDTDDRLLATLAAHFAYGAACGGLYSGLVPPASRNVTTGIIYGLGVWAGSYLWMLPAADLHPPPERHPASRTALMIAAHVVYGGVLGWMTAPQTGKRQEAS